MKKKHLAILFLTSLLFVTVAIAQSVPSPVTAQIQRDAQARYPNDYEMQEFKIKEQTQAYINVQSYSAMTLPKNIFAQIKRDAVAKYPRDYEMQEFKIKEQIKAYRAVQSYAAVDIPQETLNRIKRSAIAKYPTDYEMQEFKIDEQVKAYRRMHGSSPTSPVVRSSDEPEVKPSSRQSTSGTIPADILKKIKARHAAEFLDNFYMQKIMVKADMKAYKEFQSYTDSQVPRQVLLRIMKKHAREFPYNYYMQKIMVDADVKAYKELQ